MRRAWLSIGVALVIVLLVLAVWLNWRGSANLVTVHNNFATTAMNVRVVLASNEIRLGDLKSKAVRDAWGTVQRDGPVEVSFELDGKQYRREYGHVTNGSSQTLIIVLAPEIFERKN